MQSYALYQALLASPENIPLRIMYLNAVYEEKAYKEVYEEARKGLTFDKHNQTFRLFVIKGAYYTGKLNIAEVVLEELMEVSEEAEVLLWAAKCRFAQEDISSAMNFYQKAIALDPDTQDLQLDKELKLRSAATEGEDAFDVSEVEKPGIRFSDVGGMEQVKKEINLKIILPMKQPELVKAYGKKAGGGILLYGPPGCGKTYIARATAGEIDGAFISVGIHEVFSMWIGESEKNMNKMFFQARRNKPCVLFFDEIDALGMARSQMRGEANKVLVNQFLTEMDGLNGENEGVLIIGATNAPWDVDAAFRRPGRFDRILFIPPPDRRARIEILKLLLQDKPVGSLNLEEIASKTVDFSGADLKGLIDRVVEEKLSNAMLSGEVEIISQKDILNVLKHIRPSTQEWFASAKNYAVYSNEGGQFDPILDYLKSKRD